MREALTEGSQERSTPAFNFRTVQHSLEEHTAARNNANNANALEEQAEENAELAAYIAELDLSPEELQQYINNPAEFLKQRRRLSRVSRRSNRNARKALKLAKSRNRNRDYVPRTSDNSGRDSPRRNGGTRRRTRRSRKSRKSRK